MDRVREIQGEKETERQHWEGDPERQRGWGDRRVRDKRESPLNLE